MTAFVDYFIDLNNGNSSGRLLQFPNTTDIPTTIQDTIKGQVFTISGDVIGRGGRDSIVAEPSDKGGFSVTDGTYVNTGMGSSSHYNFTYLFNINVADTNNGVRCILGGYHFAVFIVDGYLCFVDSSSVPLTKGGADWVVYKIENNVDYSIVMTSDRFGTPGNSTRVKFYVNGALVGDSYADGISITSSRYSTVNRPLIDYNNTSYKSFGKSAVGDPDDAIISDIGYTPRTISDHEASKLTALAKYTVGSATVSGTIIEGYQVDDYLVRVHILDDGTLVSEETTNTGSFSMIVPDLDYYVTVIPVIGDAWEPDLIYELDMKVYPRNPSSTRFYFKCTTAGSSGSIEPVWNTNENGTTVDGDAVWTVVENIPQPITHAPVRGVV